MCYNPKIHRYTECLSGLPREIAATVIVIGMLVIVIGVIGLIVTIIRDK